MRSSGARRRIRLPRSCPSGPSTSSRSCVTRKNAPSPATTPSPSTAWACSWPSSPVGGPARGLRVFVRRHLEGGHAHGRMSPARRRPTAGPPPLSHGRPAAPAPRLAVHPSGHFTVSNSCGQIRINDINRSTDDSSSIRGRHGHGVTVSVTSRTALVQRRLVHAIIPRVPPALLQRPLLEHYWPFTRTITPVRVEFYDVNVAFRGVGTRNMEGYRTATFSASSTGLTSFYVNDASVVVSILSARGREIIYCLTSAPAGNDHAPRLGATRGVFQGNWALKPTPSCVI